MSSLVEWSGQLSQSISCNHWGGRNGGKITHLLGKSEQGMVLTINFSIVRIESSTKLSPSQAQGMLEGWVSNKGRKTKKKLKGRFDQNLEDQWL